MKLKSKRSSFFICLNPLRLIERWTDFVYIYIYIYTHIYIHIYIYIYIYSYVTGDSYIIQKIYIALIEHLDSNVHGC